MTVHCQCFHQQGKITALIGENLMGIIGDHDTNIKYNSEPADAAAAAVLIFAACQK